jgi:acyl-coenzyme A synthetase/AMP-(fatty) acid ligase
LPRIPELLVAVLGCFRAGVISLCSQRSVHPQLRIASLLRAAPEDEDGNFFFVARRDDIITSAGYRIGPFEIESALMEHPAIAEVAVIGKPDPQRTEIVKAFAVLRQGFSPSDELIDELQQYVRAAPFASCLSARN